MNAASTLARPSLRTRILLAALVVVLLALTGAARAQAESYTSKTMSDACGQTYADGKTDQSGILYEACGTQIRIYAKGQTTGNPTQTVSSSGWSFSSVAPSPDGTYIYADPNESGHAVVRFDRQANGTYKLDATWALASFPYEGKNWAFDGMYIATDAWGNIYASNGVWAANTVSRIVKYDANGKYVTGFGDYILCGNPALACSWAAGQFYTVPTGLAVSADGSKVYVTEKDNSRVQEFDYTANGTYQWVRMWGNQGTDPKAPNYDPNRVGACSPGAFGAPYDVGVDRWGYVYVASTTCKQVQKFTADGTYLASISVNGNGNRNHGLAVDWNGDVWSGETSIVAVNNTPPAVTPPVPQPLPVADTVAPTLTALTIPANVTSTTVSVAVTAADNQGGSGLDQVCFIDQTTYAMPGTCVPYAATVTTTVPDVTNDYSVEAYVTDNAGNMSAPIYSNGFVYRHQAPVGPAPDTTAPVIASVSVPATVASTTVPVTISATDDKGVTQMRFVDINTGGAGAWMPYAANATTTIPNVTNDYKVEVQVEDAAGNISNAMLSNLFTYRVPTAPAPPKDTTAPVVVSVSIPASTTTEQVTATVTATDDTGVAQIRFIDEDGNAGAWQKWAPEANDPTTAVMTALLSPGANEKALTVQVEDAAGNVSALDTAAEIAQARAFTRCVPCTAPAAGFNALELRQSHLTIKGEPNAFSAGMPVFHAPKPAVKKVAKKAAKQTVKRAAKHVARRSTKRVRHTVKARKAAKH